MSFWETTDRPLFVLAPMSGVTDAAFRRLVAKYGKPDVLVTEFVSCDGLCSRGREHLLRDLWFDESERPIVAQIFGSTPENFCETAKLLVELGFDGIDINTGCPDKNVNKQGAGTALIETPCLFKEIVAATKEGAGDIPVSIKTRIGVEEITIDSWILDILETKPAAITIHGRTRKEMSNVPTHWDAIELAKKIAVERGETVPILGNGDILTVPQAREYCERYNLDGMMIGRGIYGKPWLFNESVTDDDFTVRLRLEILIEHVGLFDKIYGDEKNFAFMRKYFKSYVAGMPDAKHLRVSLLDSKDADEVRSIVGDYLATHAEYADLTVDARFDD